MTPEIPAHFEHVLSGVPRGISSVLPPALTARFMMNFSHDGQRSDHTLNAATNGPKPTRPNANRGSITQVVAASEKLIAKNMKIRRHARARTFCRGG